MLQQFATVNCIWKAFHLEITKQSETQKQLRCRRHNWGGRTCNRNENARKWKIITKKRKTDEMRLGIDSRTHALSLYSLSLYLLLKWFALPAKWMSPSVATHIHIHPHTHNWQQQIHVSTATATRPWTATNNAIKNMFLVQIYILKYI